MQTRMIKTLLIDDDLESKSTLEKIFQDACMDVELVGKCSSADEAIEQIQVLKPELILLDIEIPGKDGFEILKAFDDPTFKVIIISKNDQYAMTAIKFDVIDYVLKPFDPDELRKSLHKISREIELLGNGQSTLNSLFKNLENKPNKLVIPTNKGFHTIAFDSIESVAAQSGNYCLFKLRSKSYDIVTKPLTYLEAMMPRNRFFRIHRSVMINLLKIESFDSKKGIVTMESGDKFEVAVRRRRNFAIRAKQCISNR